MDSSVGRSLFQKRNERIDWRKLAAVDVEKIARDVDVDAIQENILNVTYCNVEHELGYHGLDANVIKLFRLAQLTIEYLLHSQEFLQQCLDEKEKKIESFNEQLSSSLSECNDVKDELLKRNMTYKNLKKEYQRAKMMIADYQLMIRAGANGLYKCGACTKSFVSEQFLKNHIERRHEGPKQMPSSIPFQSSDHDESFHNELNEIKTRLKMTEDELKKEQENVRQLNLKESDRSKDLIQILKQQESWKAQEQEQIKAEMEAYKEMMLKELKETQKEKDELLKSLRDIQSSTETWKKQCILGNLEDDDGNDTRYEDLSMKIQELKEEVQVSQRENEKLKKYSERWKTTARSLTGDNQKYMELVDKVHTIEGHYKKELGRLTHKYEHGLAETKSLFKEYLVKLENHKSSVVPTGMDEADYAETLSKFPMKSTLEPDADGDSVTLWVSSNLSIMNSYRVSRKTVSVKADWKDWFSFRVFVKPYGMFKKPIHVYTCGGSPYWRQYISLSQQPPSPNYKKEFTFYGADSRVEGTVKLFILEIGSGTVIRSMISKKEFVEGWKGKGVSFFAMKPLMLQSSFNRSGTSNSDVFRSVSDEDVSISSFTGTDLVKENLVETLRMSRDNLVDDEEVSKEEVAVEKVNDLKEKLIDDGKAFDATGDGEQISESEEENNDDNYSLTKETRGDDKFIGTSSSSFLGATLPEKGEFYPFPHNQLAAARYNHKLEMVYAQREEMVKILEDNLINRGIDTDETKMSSRIFTSKMQNHEKELRLIEKKYKGFNLSRKRLFESLNDFAVEECNKKKKEKVASKIKTAEIALKAAVRFKDEAVHPKQPHNIISSSDNVDSKFHSKKESKTFISNINDDNEDFEVSDSSEWNSEELSLKQAKNKDIPKIVIPIMKDNDVSSPGIGYEEDVMQTPSPLRNGAMNGGDFEVSDSSEWDSDELSVKHLQDSPYNDGMDNHTLENSFDRYSTPYNPKLRPPQGDNVRQLAASLESTLGSRDRSKKKLAGAVDLYDL